MDVMISQFEDFRKATTLLYRPRLFSKKEITSQLFVPYVVNGAFCIEIGLKAILKDEKIEYERKHQLFDLYNLLPDIDKKFIFQKMCEYRHSRDRNEKGFNLLLEQISNNFHEFRYYFDFKKVLFTNWLFIHDFIEAINLRFSGEFENYILKELNIETKRYLK